MWTGRRVVLGVSGGIASYKSCILARRLTEAGAGVDVVMTRAAQEFVRPLTFEALTGRPVLASLWEQGRALSHVRLGQDADLIVVAPATAQLLARFAQGLADDFLTTLLLASTAPVLLAPAMNDEMFAAGTTRANVELLRQRATIVGPATGALAEGPSDRPGRMSEPEVIMAHAERLLRRRGSRLDGKRIIVTAGPTRESIDPVRVISNRSSGRMGFALAQAAWARGADVLLVSGPSALAAPEGVEVLRIESTAELASAVEAALPGADAMIMAAAPADYRPAKPAEVKRARGQGEVTMALEPTPDVLASTIGRRKPGAIIVGFALETGSAMARAQQKLSRKQLDLIVVNDALEPGAGFEVATNRVTLLGKDGSVTELPLASKHEVAHAILDAVEARLG
ncbi:MAG TPA: bifunctional phosphopantothenoylcysteine decarboxylase/phosphopantothenate--cysteine ligase CoaBC [Gemmatimonadales bacterium]